MDAKQVGLKPKKTKRRGPTLATRVAKSKATTGDMTRAAKDAKNKARRKKAIETIRANWSDRYGDDILHRYHVDELEDICDRESESTEEELALLCFEPPVFDKPNGTLIVGPKSDPVNGVYAADVLADMPSEAWRRAIVKVDRLGREELANLVRCIKPGAQITFKSA